MKKLVDEGELINWRENLSTDSKVEISLFRRKDIRYYLKNTKTLLNYINYFDVDLNKALGNYAEFLTEVMFKSLGFEIENRNTNEFNGVKWKRTDHDLDFIVSKNDIFYGVEVKNTFEYIPREEFEIKMFKMCPYLNLIPMCVFRFAPKFYIDELNKKDGFGFVFKSKVFPYGQERIVSQLWRDTLLPVRVSTELSRKGENNFRQWHEKKLSKLATL